MRLRCPCLVGEHHELGQRAIERAVEDHRSDVVRVALGVLGTEHRHVREAQPVELCIVQRVSGPLHVANGVDRPDGHQVRPLAAAGKRAVEPQQPQIVRLPPEEVVERDARIGVGVWVESEHVRTRETAHTSTAYLTMVALDDQGHPTATPPLAPETQDERGREQEAQLRRDNRLAEREAILRGREERG
jgi:hypothetical protein